MYPFVISDASSDTRRYTLYASSERDRTNWKEVLEEAISLRKAWVDANSVSEVRLKRINFGIDTMGQLFAFNSLSDGFMREQTVLVPSSLKKNLTGPMVTVTIFSE
jgi:RHO1 GDP-GTP exchange protein 1/2